MALFAVNRKQNNKGSGVRSGVWKFVEVNQWSRSWGKDGVCYTPISDALRFTDMRIYRGVAS